MTDKKKFKLGDRVMSTTRRRGGPYSITCEGWEGKVVEIKEEGWMRVQADNDRNRWIVETKHFILAKEKEDLRLT